MSSGQSAGLYQLGCWRGRDASHCANPELASAEYLIDPSAFTYSG